MAKSVMEHALIACGAARISLARQPRDAALVLAYHNVLPRGTEPSGDRSLHLDQDDFARQLDLLEHLHEVVPLSAVLNDPVATAGGRRRVAITFDDAYLGALTVGVAEIRKRRLPATVFVAPDLLGQIPWWDALARSSPVGLTSKARTHALGALAGQQERVLEWAGLSAASLLSPTPSERIATVEQLVAATTYPALTLAPHTWSHSNLGVLTGEEMIRELTLPLHWLRARFSSIALSVLSYPYGLFSPAATEGAAQSGYSAAFRVNGGWLAGSVAQSNRYALPRYNVPAGLSLRGFQLRLSAIGTDS